MLLHIVRPICSRTQTLVSYVLPDVLTVIELAIAKSMRTLDRSIADFVVKHIYLET